MQKQDITLHPKNSYEEETNASKIVKQNEDLEENIERTPNAAEGLEENDLTVEVADHIESEKPEEGSSGSEEKDITD